MGSENGQPDRPEQRDICGRDPAVGEVQESPKPVDETRAIATKLGNIRAMHAERRKSKTRSKLKSITPETIKDHKFMMEAAVAYVVTPTRAAMLIRRIVDIATGKD